MIITSKLKRLFPFVESTVPAPRFYLDAKNSSQSPLLYYTNTLSLSAPRRLKYTRLGVKLVTQNLNSISVPLGRVGCVNYAVGKTSAFLKDKNGKRLAGPLTIFPDLESAHSFGITQCASYHAGTGVILLATYREDTRSEGLGLPAGYGGKIITRRDALPANTIFCHSITPLMVLPLDMRDFLLENFINTYISVKLQVHCIDTNTYMIDPSIDEAKCNYSLDHCHTSTNT